MTIAHVFWHGELTRYELISLQSIVNQGFDVWFWSLSDYDLPKLVRHMDASLVVPAELVTAYRHEHWNKEWGAATELTSITLYSDILRYKLLELYGGWWFDLDTICLKSASKFDELSSGLDICIGWQSPAPGELSCNNAVLSIPNKSIAYEVNEIVAQLLETKTTFSWGEIGPDLWSKYLEEARLLDQVLPRTVFYPNSTEPNVQNIWKRLSKLSAGEVEDLEAETADSYVLHWSNNNLLPSDKKSFLPSEDSFLGRLFNSVTRQVVE
jgi:hypothetical protein